MEMFPLHRHGIVIGHHMTPQLAVILMDSLEQKTLSGAKEKSEVYNQYVDDCFLAWIHGTLELEILGNHGWQLTVPHHQVKLKRMSSQLYGQIIYREKNDIQDQLFKKPSSEVLVMS